MATVGKASEAGGGCDSCADTGADGLICRPSISMIGFMLDIIVGSFEISSGLESREERISPEGKADEAVVPVPDATLGDAVVAFAENFCKSSLNIRS